jgi:NADH:ubiquinone oxidoreductase subunit 6 (subunit J)
MTYVIFFIAAIGALAGAIGVVTVRNAFYSVLALVGHLLSLAGLFLLLRAEFVAASQVVVYAGAVMVLYVFVVSYVGGDEEPLGGRVDLRAGERVAATPVGSGMRLGAGIFGGAIAVELFIAVLGSGLKAIGHKGAPYVAGFGSPQQIGQLLLTRFLYVFEAASFLLLIAAVGAVVLARRRGGIDDEDETRISFADLLRPGAVGTMAEGVGRIGPRGGASVPDEQHEPARVSRDVTSSGLSDRGSGRPAALPLSGAERAEQ